VTDVYEIGGRRLGVRWSQPGLANSLARLARAYAGPGDAPPNLSVVVGGSRGRAKDKHHLYVQGRHLSATADDGRLLRSVIRAASALVATPTTEQLRLDALPVVAPDGSVVIVDHGLDHELRAIQRRIEQRGYRVLDCAAVALDPSAGQVVLPDARAAFDLDAQAFTERFPTGAADDDLGALQAPIAGIVYACHQAPASRAAEVAFLGALARTQQGTLRTEDVARFPELTDRTPAVPYVFTDPPALIDLVTARR
jgi:hypothetical protein